MIVVIIVGSQVVGGELILNGIVLLHYSVVWINCWFTRAVSFVARDDKINPELKFVGLGVGCSALAIIVGAVDKELRKQI